MISINPLGIKDITSRYSNTPLSDSSISSTITPAAINIVVYSIEYLSISPQYSYLILLINTPNTPSIFNKRDITPFLRLFDIIYKNYNIPLYMRIKYLT